MVAHLAARCQLRGGLGVDPGWPARCPNAARHRGGLLIPAIRLGRLRRTLHGLRTPCQALGPPGTSPKAPARAAGPIPEPHQR